MHHLLFQSRRVNFSIAGVQKGGSTALSSFLAQHPDVCFSTVKEPHFFDAQPFQPNYAAYHAQFPLPRGRTAIGEGTASYVRSDEARERIKAYNPDMRIIFVIRNPIERAYSQYQMHVAKYDLAMPFLECVRLGERRRPLHEHAHMCERTFPAYLGYSVFADRIEGFKRAFPHVLCIRNEDLRQRHDETMRTVFEFLGVSDPELRIERQVVHSNTYAPMSADVWAFLNERLSPEIDRLEEVTGWDLADWRTSPHQVG